ncbi:hypothetical protein TEQUI_0123 [Taylorella equigenitalis MCE9]|uniref:Uncharacterized protein n=3 Tax=Taylorella equigenitalis TaxID=29575 RepID=A0A654KFC0_TAYEM|nr:hypothetical protein TEQUI_0123 [Taylorella equigenitalis MCE9]
MEAFMFDYVYEEEPLQDDLFTVNDYEEYTALNLSESLNENPIDNFEVAKIKTNKKVFKPRLTQEEKKAKLNKVILRIKERYPEAYKKFQNQKDDEKQSKLLDELIL